MLANSISVQFEWSRQSTENQQYTENKTQKRRKKKKIICQVVIIKVEIQGEK